MKKNLTNKILLIIATLVVFLYGIFGVPSGVTGNALSDALTQRIHLGLDLRGGAHLILQVVVSEAVSAETDNTVARVQADLKTANIAFSQVFKPNPAKPELIEIDGVSESSLTAFATRCARCLASRTPVSGRITANSSPP